MRLDTIVSARQSGEETMMTEITSPGPDATRVTTIPRLTVAETFPALGSRPGGLSQDEAEQRLQRYGKNLITEVKGKPLWVKFLANFTHVMAILLWVGGIVGFIAQMPQLGVAVWIVNIINGAFSFWQEFKAEKATDALRLLLRPTRASCEAAKTNGSWPRNWCRGMLFCLRKATASRPMRVSLRRMSSVSISPL